MADDIPKIKPKIRKKVRPKLKPKPKTKISITIKRKVNIKPKKPKVQTKWNKLQKFNKSLGANKVSQDDLSDFYNAHKSLPFEEMKQQFLNPPNKVVPVQSEDDFFSLQGRFRVELETPDGVEDVQVVFVGGKGNYKNFKDLYEDWVNGDIGTKLFSQQFSDLRFVEIPPQAPDKTKAKKNAERYNRNGFHCIWTPIALYHKRLADNSPNDNKRRRKYVSEHRDKYTYYMEKAQGPASDSATIQAVCDEKNIQITIEYVGFDLDNIEVFKRGSYTKEKHYFICVRSDHVEYRHRHGNLDVVLSPEEFKLKLAQEPMIHPVKVRRPERIYDEDSGESYMETCSDRQRIYCFESYQDNVRYIMEGYEHFLDKDSATMQYMKEMSYWSMPNDIPVSKLIRCCLRHPLHCSRGKITDDMYVTDATKCFANFKLNKYYKGAPGKLHNWQWYPDESIYLEYPGYWYIEHIEGNLPFQGSVDGAWTTIALKYFTDLGIKFKVKYGAWSYDWVQIPEFPQQLLDNKMYARIIGLLGRPGEFEYKQKWLDPENILDVGRGIKVTTKKYNFRHFNMICAYFLDYAWTRVHERAVKEDAVAIFVDEIVTRKPLESMEGWHESKPINGKHETISFADYCVSSKEYTEKINPTPAKLPYTYEHDFRKCHDREIFADGAGGTGKTTTVAHQFAYIGAGYMALAKSQVERFVGPGKPFLYGTNVHRAAYEQWLPGVIVVDEVSQLTLAHGTPSLFEIREAFGATPMLGIEPMCRIIYAGDRAQVPISLNHSSEPPDMMWEWLSSLKVFHFKCDHRSKDARTRQFKAKLRDIVLSGNPDYCDQSKIKQIRQLCRKHCKNRPKDFKGLIIGNRKQKEEETDKEYLSIDKTQGATFTDKYCVQINGYTHRNSIFHKLVYTGLSRCTKLNDVYINDITSLVKSSQMSASS